MNEENAKSGVAFFKDEDFHGKLQHSAYDRDGRKLVVGKDSMKPQTSGFYEYEVEHVVGTTAFVKLTRGDRELSIAYPCPLPEELLLKFRLHKGRVVSETVLYGTKCVVLLGLSLTPNDWCTEWKVTPVRAGYAIGYGPAVYVEVTAEVISKTAKRRRDRKVEAGKRKPDTHTVVVKGEETVKTAAA